MVKTLCSNIPREILQIDLYRSICNISLVVSYCTLSALLPAAEQLLRQHGEEESDWSDGESETEPRK